MLAIQRMADDKLPDPYEEYDSQRQQVNFRLTGDARRVLRRMAFARGISQTAVVETIIREEAERRGFILTNKKPST